MNNHSRFESAQFTILVTLFVSLLTFLVGGGRWLFRDYPLTGLIISVIALATFLYIIIFIFQVALSSVSIQQLKILSRIPLFFALGLGVYYASEFNPTLIWPLIALIIGYVLVLIFARESGNVPN